MFFSAESPRRVTALYALEKGQFKGYYNFAAGDLFRIERINGVVKYYQNGNLLYTSLVPSTTALMVDVSTDALGISIENIRTSFTSKPASTIITNYVRDASGNVMAIYQSPLSSEEGTGLPAGQAGLRLIEQPIYGSSRLGMYTGGRKEGQRRLGQKNYELSNHLGNVLTVITDNINMSATDGVTATVVSASDYYPFGLEMEGRTFSDEKYRYGFNGKEKDNSFASDNSYDYGFRIYNPRIAKFLSVDPLTKSYPWYTPYQFAGNTPIQAIDLDGLEKVIVTKYAYLIGYIPKLKKSEWYVIEDQVDWKSFSSAAKYNIGSNNPGAYQNIEDRHNWYVWAAQNAKDNYWFSAASNVTSWSMVGGAEMLGSGIFISKDAKDVLVGANKFLLKENFKNFGKYAMGEGPVTWNGKSYGHLSGKDLDNQMVVIEMSTLQGYLDDFKSDYIKKNGEEKWDNLKQDLNSLFSNKFLRKFTPEANKYAQDEFKKEFGEDETFDFTNLEHRIFQGQKMAEFDRKNAEKKKQ